MKAVEKWQHPILPCKVAVYTERQPLHFLMSLEAAKPSKGRVAGWMDLLAEVPVSTIVYGSGATNVVASALSALPHTWFSLRERERLGAIVLAREQRLLLVPCSWALA